MENNNTKIWQVVLGVLVVIGIIIWVTSMPKPAEVPVDTETPGSTTTGGTSTSNGGTNVWQDPNIKAEQLCYIWNSEGGDKALLSMDIRAGQVMGEFKWVPREKDQKVGTFEGTISGVDAKTKMRTVNALWKSSGEGMLNTEELIIHVGATTAGAGFGEMKLRQDGVWIYADPANVSYLPTLQLTDCGDEAMD